MKINKDQVIEWTIIGILAFILWYLFIGNPAQAETRCYTDQVGFTHCKDDKGNEMRGTKDAQGNTFYKFDDDDVYKSRKDTQGNIRIDKIRGEDK
jgi:hypothetical protein